jgi:hypothetical protein
VPTGVYKRLYKRPESPHRGTPELRTVMFHHWCIFTSDCPDRHTYKGMPFHDDWNPQKGGSYDAAVDWIVENIGKKSEQPKGSSLHVVEHSLGFVPGNLEWATAKKQTAQQMYKIIANQRNEITRLKEIIAKLW